MFPNCFSSTFMEETSQNTIQRVFEQKQIAVQGIRPPASVSASRLTTEDLFQDGPWLALIALAGIIILFCIIGIIVICFTWARYELCFT